VSRVFVVQDQRKRDKKSGELVSKFDLSSAEKYGEIIYCLTPTARPFASEHVIAGLTRVLRDFGDDDWLLLIGNPCLIGFAVSIASWANGGRVRLLQWDGMDYSYREIKAILPTEPSAASLLEMPEISDETHRRIPGTGLLADKKS